MSPRDIEKRLDHMELLLREMHAKVMSGESAEIQPGDPEIKRAVREMMKGNMEPVRALGGKKISERASA
jgi:hypothetical protein